MICGTTERNSAKADSEALLIDATSWYAGTRDCSFGVHLGLTRRARRQALQWSNGTSDRKRVCDFDQSGEAVSSPTVRGVGSLSWTDLAAILRDCEHADVLTHIERALARNVVRWLERVGIS